MWFALSKPYTSKQPIAAAESKWKKKGKVCQCIWQMPCTGMGRLSKCIETSNANDALFPSQS